MLKRSRSYSKDNLTHLPDPKGYYGCYGGTFMPETLMTAIEELRAAYRTLKSDPRFLREFHEALKRYAGRPTPLTEANNLAKALGIGRLLLKREDLNHTGSHKINNTIGQALLTRYMKKTRVIAETGAGQHGVATATVAALYGLKCDVYMGQEDVERQALNVFRMRLLGARVIPVHSGSRTLKDAINEAMRDWVSNVLDTHYIIGTVMGPHPYPQMVCDFQSVIGREVKWQIRQYGYPKPTHLLACIGGGSNSIGLFHPWLKESCRLIGVEAAGLGIASGKHAATLTKGRTGVFHGMKSQVLQNRDGQIQIAHSISAGLDYPGVGPEHAYLKKIGRAEYQTATDADALLGMRMLSQTEGIIPALEPAHAIGYLVRHRKRFGRKSTIVLCLSGRGDKDMIQVAKIMDLQ